MEELELVKVERVSLQEEYLNQVQSIWLDDSIEAIKRDAKARKLYKEYKHKDLFLEKLEANLEDIIENFNHYREKMKNESRSYK